MLWKRTFSVVALAVWAVGLGSPADASDRRRLHHPKKIDVIPIGEYALFPDYMIGNPHCYLRHVEVNDQGVTRIVTEQVCN